MIFSVFSDDWGRHPSSCQHLFRHILANHPVVWVNTVGLRTPRLTVYDWARAFQVLRRWLLSRANPQQTKSQDATPFVLSPVMFPSFRWVALSSLNQLLLESAVRRALAKHPGQPAVLVSTLPIIPRLFASNLFLRTIYYCVDDFTLWPGMNGEVMRRLEAETLEECNALVATSDELLSTRGAKVPRSFLLTHGVDYDHFAKAASLSPPAEISKLPRPIIGMFGIFDDRTDGDLLRHIANSFPEGSIAIVGPVDRDTAPFADLTNIHFLGQVPYSDLPHWISGFDVCILPYKMNRLTRSINPLKLREYLATGKPVVTTPLPEAVKLGRHLTVADASSFPEAIRASLRRASSDPLELSRWLATESWENKSQQFLKFALEGL